MVDSGAEKAADKVVATIEEINKMSRPPGTGPCFGFALCRYVAGHACFRTHVDSHHHQHQRRVPDHTGGNAKIVNSKDFHPIGILDADEQGSETILAQEMLQRRMMAEKAPDDAVPTTTYFSQKYTLHRFFNNQAIQVFHMDNAITDGDSAVFFRKSDVIATGDVYISDSYPPIDVDKGTASIDGEITSLNKIFDMCVLEFMAQGGTMIIPGRGWISDAADLGYYRDMLTVIRERIQGMVDRKMTLAQVKAAKPTMDYDVEYGRYPGSTVKFVEAVYRSLAEKKGR